MNVSQVLVDAVYGNFDDSITVTENPSKNFFVVFKDTYNHITHSTHLSRVNWFLSQGITCNQTVNTNHIRRKIEEEKRQNTVYQYYKEFVSNK